MRNLYQLKVAVSTSSHRSHDSYRRWRTEYVLTVSFYSWELRACYLFKVDVSTMRICITPPPLPCCFRAREEFMGRTSAVSGDASKRATWSYPSSHCQAERLYLQLCNATTEREKETQGERR